MVPPEGCFATFLPLFVGYKVSETSLSTADFYTCNIERSPNCKLLRLSAFELLQVNVGVPYLPSLFVPSELV